MFRDNLYRVRCGAGIGLLHAGDVANACFFSMVERPLRRAGAYDAADLYEHFRYQDDMLFICRSGRKFNSLLREMRNRSVMYELTVEETSAIGFRYLDIDIVRDGDKLRTSPHWKDPGLSRRLSTSSAHQAGIHKAWPNMMVKKAAELSASPSVFNNYMCKFEANLKASGCFLPNSISGDLPSTRVQTRRRGFQDFWLVVAFHPWWDRPIQRAINRINRDSNAAALLQLANRQWNLPRVRISWSNALPCVRALLAKD